MWRTGWKARQQLVLLAGLQLQPCVQVRRCEVTVGLVCVGSCGSVRCCRSRGVEKRLCTSCGSDPDQWTLTVIGRTAPFSSNVHHECPAAQIYWMSLPRALAVLSTAGTRGTRHTWLRRRGGLLRQAATAEAQPNILCDGTGASTHTTVVVASGGGLPPPPTLSEAAIVRMYTQVASCTTACPPPP